MKNPLPSTIDKAIIIELIIIKLIGPLFIITGVGLLIFSPIGKLISLFIILFGVYFIFQGKVIANNEINIPVDENHHQCQNCSHVQRKEINRCLKCGELIEDL